jgi:uncharacterized membrane protein YccF (DUF307 family)
MAAEQTPAATQQVTTHKRTANPGCLLSTLWFIFFGWWLGLWAILGAWLLNITIIGLPLGLFILNHLPFLLILQPPSMQEEIVTTADGVDIHERDLPQINFFLRAIYFLLVGWWWSLIWLLLAYVFCLTIIGLPLGVLMFRMAPSMTTLKRY